MDFSWSEPRQALTASTLEGAWTRIRQKAGFEDVRLHDLRHTVGTYAGQSGRHVAFLDLPAPLAALTPKRQDPLRYVRHHQVCTVRALAADLRRDDKKVHKDVEELTKLGLLARTADQASALHAEVDARFILQIRDGQSGCDAPIFLSRLQYDPLAAITFGPLAN